MQKADLYKEFFFALSDIPESKIPADSKAIKTGRGSVSLGSVNGLSFWYKIKGNMSQIALYIERPSKSENERIFHELKRHQSRIENLFGAKFEWEELEKKVPCRIYYEMEVGEIEYKKDKWKEIQLEMIESMVRFQKSTSPFIEN